MCITEDHLLSREGWSQLELLYIEMELTGHPEIWSFGSREIQGTINGQFEDVTATILREIEDSGFEMELEEELARLDFNILFRISVIIIIICVHLI